MKITINERTLVIPENTTLFALREQIKPQADLMVFNGAVTSIDLSLSEGDQVVFIQRGEFPPEEELEALLAARHTPGVHQKVKKATVGIAGLGGLGSTVAIALARIGIGRLVIADFDVVEPSNLNRQQYFIDQIGQMKTDALKENLKRINPYVDVVAHTIKLDEHNLGDFFSKVDVMVEAFDTAETKAMILENFTAVCPGIPLVMAMGLAGYFSNNTIRTKRLGRDVYVVGDLVHAAAPGCGLMAPRVGIAAHHQANAVLRLILGETPEEGDDPE